MSGYWFSATGCAPTEDRANYERTKRELAQHNWRYLQHYANAKSDIIEEILARALRGRG